jgi:serine/threonine protein kinase
MMRFFSRKKRCPGCGRARVPERTECPFCHNPYDLPRDVTWDPFSPLRRSRLIVIEGPGFRQEIPITTKQFTIGRSGTNNLRLEGLLISREHALIAFENDQYVLYDRNSTNGTYVNGRRIAQHILGSGDQIQIGSSVFLFQMAGEHVPTTPPQPHRVPTPAPPPRIRRDFGDYQLVEKIGSGGAATVYKGVLRDNHQAVAIKILHERDPYIRDKFMQEGPVAEGLSHPHIARIIHYGPIADTFYIVMEYVDQGSLRDRLAPGQALPWDLVVSVLGQTAEALDYAHGEGVIHRDIKPENIMFSSQQGVKIVDFGIAKMTSSITRTTDGLIVGTPYYLSVEQAKGLPVNPRSDIYSLGVVLYEMITGQVPFTGKALEVVDKHIKETPIPPSRVKATVSPQVESVTLRALQKRPQERFQSAGEMARALGYAMPAPSPIPYERPTSARKGPPVKAAQLAIMSGQARGKMVPLSSGISILRRRDINPKDMLISREHARIFQQGQQLWLEDLDSTNGTFHNGHRIFDRVLLRDGDEIRLGNAALHVRM